MKKYEGAFDDLYVGRVDEIRPFYKSLRRAYMHSATNFVPSHCGHAIFVEGRRYGIHIDYHEMVFTIVSGETADNLTTSGWFSDYERLAYDDLFPDLEVDLEF